ncbi:unnamed protein product [Effrenium voratum]|nr:unnamed protein product [Effrenium voratum]
MGNRWVVRLPTQHLTHQLAHVHGSGRLRVFVGVFGNHACVPWCLRDKATINCFCPATFYECFTSKVTKEADVEKAVAEVKKEFGRVDCLFNNAGYQGLFAPVDDYSVEDFEKVLKINVTGVFSMLKYVSKVMIDQKGGSIVNTASCAGLGCPTAMPAYGTSKAAVLHLTKISALDLAPSNVRVNSAFIGPEDGFMWRRQVELQAQANPTHAPERLGHGDEGATHWLKNIL